MRLSLLHTLFPWCYWERKDRHSIFLFLMIEYIEMLCGNGEKDGNTKTEIKILCAASYASCFLFGRSDFFEDGGRTTYVFAEVFPVLRDCTGQSRLLCSAMAASLKKNTFDGGICK